MMTSKKIEKLAEVFLFLFAAALALAFIIGTTTAFAMGQWLVGAISMIPMFGMIALVLIVLAEIVKK